MASLAMDTREIGPYVVAPDTVAALHLEMNQMKTEVADWRRCEKVVMAAAMADAFEREQVAVGVKVRRTEVEAQLQRRRIGDGNAVETAKIVEEEENMQRAMQRSEASALAARGDCDRKAMATCAKRIHKIQS